ncbi:hypothetical protein [Streptomyces sp. NBC_00388]|uniref:hypothetical protein n=1 Tax=Streptomyces sp. NBC_00388 TaxID=2975735 RepID=UPI002E1ABA34
MGAVDGCRTTGDDGSGPAERVLLPPGPGRSAARGWGLAAYVKRLPASGKDLLRGEWLRIAVQPWRTLRRRGAPGVALGVLAVLSVIVVHELLRTHAGALAIRLTGEVRGDLPLPLVLLRTPVSLVLADPGLPVWAGLPRLFLAVALAELLIGRGRTLLIACGTSLAGTLGARAMIALGHGPLGLPPGTAHVLDTGPSAAVAGLFAYLAVVRRAPVFGVLTSGVIVVQSVLRPNLAGREHLLAVGLAVVAGALVSVRSRRTGGEPTGPVPADGRRRRAPRGRGGVTGFPGRAGVLSGPPASFRPDPCEDRRAKDHPDDVDLPGRIHRGP